MCSTTVICFIILKTKTCCQCPTLIIYIVYIMYFCQILCDGWNMHKRKQKISSTLYSEGAIELCHSGQSLDLKTIYMVLMKMVWRQMKMTMCDHVEISV